MSFSREAHVYCSEVLKIRRDKASSEQYKNTVKIHNLFPRISEIDKELSQTYLKISRIMYATPNFIKEISNLKESNLALQNEKKQILKSNGYSEDFMEIKFHCPLCEDTGFVNNEMCDCYKKLLHEFTTSSLSKNSPLKLSSFDTFDVSLFSDIKDEITGKNTRQWMNGILNYCIEYATNFDLNSPNLLLFGNTGLGKTHLSLAIANKVIESGYNVLYGSFPDIMNSLELERFSQGKSETNSLESICKCDLLVLDDVGAEMTTQYTISTLYLIINNRINSGIPTIINTNLSIKELESKYSQRITSRLIGEYEQLAFIGRDIRQILKKLSK